MVVMTCISKARKDVVN